MAEAIQIQLRSIPRAIPSLVTPILVLLIVTISDYYTISQVAQPNIN